MFFGNPQKKDDDLESAAEPPHRVNGSGFNLDRLLSDDPSKKRETGTVRSSSSLYKGAHRRRATKQAQKMDPEDGAPRPGSPTNNNGSVAWEQDTVFLPPAPSASAPPAHAHAVQRRIKGGGGGGGGGGAGKSRNPRKSKFLYTFLNNAKLPLLILIVVIFWGPMLLQSRQKTSASSNRTSRRFLSNQKEADEFADGDGSPGRQQRPRRRGASRNRENGADKTDDQARYLAENRGNSNGDDSIENGEYLNKAVRKGGPKSVKNPEDETPRFNEGDEAGEDDPFTGERQKSGVRQVRNEEESSAHSVKRKQKEQVQENVGADGEDAKSANLWRKEQLAQEQKIAEQQETILRQEKLIQKQQMEAQAELLRAQKEAQEQAKKMAQEELARRQREEEELARRKREEEELARRKREEEELARRKREEEELAWRKREEEELAQRKRELEQQLQQQQQAQAAADARAKAAAEAAASKKTNPPAAASRAPKPQQPQLPNGGELGGGDYSKGNLAQVLPGDMRINFADVWDPHLKQSDVPLFWHIPKNGGTSMADIFTHCLNLVSASNIGATEGHGQEPSLQVNTYHDRGRYVNVNVATVDGIQRAKQLNLVSSHLADVVVTHRLHDSAIMFDPNHKARAFAMFRHPVDRAVSMFYYLSKAKWEPTYDHALANMTLDEYATSGKAEENWVTRFLTGQYVEKLTKDHVTLAKEIMRRKLVVGVLERFGESMKRFELYFDWWRDKVKADPEKALSCQYEKFHRSQNQVPHPVPDRSSAAYKKLLKLNWADVELYNFATKLFDEQAVLVRGQDVALL